MLVVPWTNKDRELLIKMWQAGSSAQLIASVLGNTRTRSAVLGYLFRLRKSQPQLGLRFENKQTKKNQFDYLYPETPKLRRVVKQQIPPPLNLFTPIKEIPPPENGVPYFETRVFQCKYILNTSKDPSNIKCCGGSTHRGTSWCHKHYDEVFIERTAPGTRAGHLLSGKIQAASGCQFRRR
jgi:hypothetical protein